MKTSTALVALLAGVGSVTALVPADTPSVRREFLATAAAAVGVAAGVQPAGAAVSGSAPQGVFILGKISKKSTVGKEIASFDSLIENFKTTRLEGGLDASKIKEPSISFVEFGQKMKDGKVTFVEFLAPNGDVAYASVNSEDGKKNERLRIGEGYPITSKKSWSSPDYVIRAVSNYGVPYAFTVPALAKFKTKKA